MIEGREFLAVADALTEFQGEAFVRTRTGRLYYGTWLDARAYCEERLGYSRKGLSREHQAVAALLGTVDDALETHLKLLRFARNQADYDDFLPEEHFDELLRTVLVSSSWVLSRLDILRKAE